MWSQQNNVEVYQNRAQSVHTFWQYEQSHIVESFFGPPCIAYYRCARTVNNEHWLFESAMSTVAQWSSSRRMISTLPLNAAWCSTDILHITQLNNLSSSHTTCSPSPAAVAQRPQQPCDRDGFRNRVTLTSGLLNTRSMYAEVVPRSEYRCTKCGVDSSSRFYSEDTHTHTHTKSQTSLTIPIPRIATLLALTDRLSWGFTVLRHTRHKKVIPYEKCPF